VEQAKAADAVIVTARRSCPGHLSGSIPTRIRFRRFSIDAIVRVPYGPIRPHAACSTTYDAKHLNMYRDMAKMTQHSSSIWMSGLRGLEPRGVSGYDWRAGLMTIKANPVIVMLGTGQKVGGREWLSIAKEK